MKTTPLRSFVRRALRRWSSQIRRWTVPVLALACGHAVIAADAPPPLQTPVLEASKVLYHRLRLIDATRGQFLALIDPVTTLAPGEGRLREAVAIAGAAPRPSWIFRAGEKSLPSVYEEVLAGARFTRSDRGSGLTSRDVGLLFTDEYSETPSKAYDAYLKALARLRRAQAGIRKLSGPSQKEAETEVASARLALEQVSSEQLEAAHARHVIAARGRPVSQIALLENYYASSGPQFFPAAADWEGSSGWVKVGFSWPEEIPDTSAFRVGAETPVPGQWLPASLSNLAPAQLRVSLEVKRVLVSHPGINLDWLRREGWTLPEADRLSDGRDPLNGQTPTGKLPLVVSGLLLMRNFTVSGPFGDEFTAAVLAEVTAGRPVRFANILLGGKGTDGALLLPAITKDSIGAVDMRIFAALLEPLGKSPRDISAP